MKEEYERIIDNKSYTAIDDFIVDCAFDAVDIKPIESAVTVRFISWSCVDLLLCHTY